MTVWFEHEHHFKTGRRKRLRMPSRMDLRRYIGYHSRLSTLPSRKQPHYDDQHIRNVPLKAYLRTLISTNRYRIYISFPHVPFWSCLHQKNTRLQVFRIYKTVWLEHENKFQNYQVKRLRIPSRTNLERYIFYRSRFLHPGRKHVLSTMHDFSTLAANNKPQIICSKY